MSNKIKYDPVVADAAGDNEQMEDFMKTEAGRKIRPL
jgi:hypothetical protein